MAISMNEIIYSAVGFFLAVIVTPIGMTYIAATNSTFGVTGTAATWAPVFTIFSTLIPVLYIVGLAMHFIPKIRG